MLLVFVHLVTTDITASDEPYLSKVSEVRNGKGFFLYGTFMRRLEPRRGGSDDDALMSGIWQV